jgi:hypothetical protein
MALIGELIAIGGVVLLLTSFGLESHSRTLARSWGATVLLAGVLSFDIEAIRRDHDNLEYGLRPGRVLIPASLALLSFSWAAVRTVIWLQNRWLRHQHTSSQRQP